MKKEILVVLSTSALMLSTSVVNASLVNSISGGIIFDMPAINSISMGPIYDPSGITWSSTMDSIYGRKSVYGFANNGRWDTNLTMVGLDFSFGTMTFSFAETLSAVGGFINYAQLGGIPLGGAPTIAIYDSADNLIELAVLNFQTSNNLNGGFFYGFEDPTSSIKYFKLSNSFISLANLTTREATPSEVPLPASFPLMFSGLAGFGILARRRKQTV